jgi:hypothetical protein
LVLVKSEPRDWILVDLVSLREKKWNDSKLQNFTATSTVR